MVVFDVAPVQRVFTEMEWSVEEVIAPWILAILVREIIHLIFFFMNEIFNFSCHAGVACRDVDNGYQCGACPPGFTGNGQNCYRLCSLNPCAPGEWISILDFFFSNFLVGTQMWEFSIRCSMRRYSYRIQMRSLPCRVYRKRNTVQTVVVSLRP